MIKLPSDLIDRCIAYGKHVVAGYQRGLHQQSRALSVRGAESNERLWAEAKMAECIFAITFGLDPQHAVKWIEQAELDGVDVIVEGTTVDVKQTQPGNKLMIWSYGKAGKLELKTNLHVLALVKCSLRDRGGEAICWIERSTFLAERVIATEGNAYRLNVGTQYMHQDDCWPLWVFPRQRVAA